MASLKRELIISLVAEAKENALHHQRALDAERKVQPLLLADAVAASHIKTRDDIIEGQNKAISELQVTNNELERLLRELGEAAFPALRKLRINSKERLRLSAAIQKASTYMIPF